MISLRLIPKIIFKPRSAFEELKDNVTASEGVLMLMLASVLSLVLFGIFASALKVNMIAFPFGFGRTLTPGSAFLFFSIQFLGILLISGISNFIAEKFSGTGNFSENFAFICYSYLFNLVPAIGSIIAILWLKVQINLVLSALNAGAAASTDFMASLLTYATYGTIIFIIWHLSIMTAAVSVSHGISRLKGFASVLAGYLSATLLSLGLTFLIAMFSRPVFAGMPIF